jgi:hypothetical protein
MLEKERRSNESDSGGMEGRERKGERKAYRE